MSEEPRSKRCRTAAAVCCPITLAPVEDPVRTLAGTIYERRAIQEWLANHTTDPCTRLYLPSKVLLPVEPGTEHVPPLEFCKSLVWTSTTPFYWSILAKDQRPASAVLNTPAYSQARWDHLVVNAFEYYATDVTPAEFSTRVDTQLNLQRAPDSSVNMEQLDLSNVTIVPSHRRELSFKCVSFRGSRFPEIVVGVQFNRCNLSHTDLRGTRFVNCVFQGEQTVFTGCVVDERTAFENCQFENDRWRLLAPNTKTRECLMSRGYPVGDM